jgi:hypothetical protein
LRVDLLTLPNGSNYPTVYDPVKERLVKSLSGMGARFNYIPQIKHMLVFVTSQLDFEPWKLLDVLRLPAFDAEVVGDDIRPSAYFTSRFKFLARLQDSQGKAFVPLYKPEVVAIIGDHNRSGFPCAKCD